MVRLVTQYNNDLKGKHKGWDGATGPWVFHMLYNNIGSSIAPWVGLMDISPEDWLDENCLTEFKLELIYE